MKKKYLNCTCYGSKNIKRKPLPHVARQAILGGWPMKQIRGWSAVSRSAAIDIALELGFPILYGDKDTGEERFYQFEGDIIRWS